MSLSNTSGLERCHVVFAIFIGTVIVNIAISLVQRKLQNTARVAFDPNWDLILDEEEAKGNEEAERRDASFRRYQASSEHNAHRGYLSRLAARTACVDSKQTERIMTSKVVSLMRQLRLHYDQVTYLGTHTARGRKNDPCLYARYRHQGISKCVGEVASLQQSKLGGHLVIRLAAADAALVQEKGWGRISGASRSFGVAVKEVAVPLPRNAEELSTVVQPVLEAAVCVVAGVEQCE